MSQVLLESPKVSNRHELSKPPTPIEAPHLAVDFSELALPSFSTIGQVSPEEIKLRPEARTQELSKMALMGRQFLARFDKSWDSPEELRQGGVRVSDLKRVELDPKPYRRPTINSKDQKKELSSITRGATYHKFSPYSTLYDYEVPVNNLPTSLDGFTILHLTDLHFRLGCTKPIEQAHFLSNYLIRLNRRIDLILLSGDDISGHPNDLCPRALDAYRAIMKAAGFPLTFRTSGNHDYYPHGQAANDQVSSLLAKEGIVDITSKHVTIAHNGSPLHLIGMDDYTEGQPIPAVKSNVTLEEPSILLVHDLSAVRADCTEVDLILSGHTHWGEIRIPFVFDGTRLMKWRGFSDAYNEQVRGWDRLTDRTLSYVGPGSARHSVWSPFFTRPGPSLLSLKASEL